MSRQSRDLYDWQWLDQRGRIHARRYYRQMRRYLTREQARTSMKDTLFGVYLGRAGHWVGSTSDR